MKEFQVLKRSKGLIKYCKALGLENDDPVLNYWLGYLAGADEAIDECHERVLKAFTKGKWRVIDIEKHTIWKERVIELYRWMEAKPSRILFWRWIKWKRRRPVWEDMDHENRTD